MKQEYNKEIQKIHASEDLIARTKKAMSEEHEKVRKKITIQVILKRTTVLTAATLVIGAFGFNYVNSKDHITISLQNDTSFSIGNRFGKKDPLENKNGIEKIQGKEGTVIPDFVKEAEFSKINGIKVQIVKAQNNVYHAGFQKNGTYFYFTGKGISQEEFIKELKKFV